MIEEAGVGEEIGEVHGSDMGSAARKPQARVWGRLIKASSQNGGQARDNISEAEWVSARAGTGLTFSIGCPVYSAMMLFRLALWYMISLAWISMSTACGGHGRDKHQTPQGKPWSDRSLVRSHLQRLLIKTPHG